MWVCLSKSWKNLCLLRVGYCSMSKIITRPTRLVSLPAHTHKTSNKTICDYFLCGSKSTGIYPVMLINKNWVASPVFPLQKVDTDLYLSKRVRRMKKIYFFIFSSFTWKWIQSQMKMTISGSGSDNKKVRVVDHINTGDGYWPNTNALLICPSL